MKTISSSHSVFFRIIRFKDKMNLQFVSIKNFLDDLKKCVLEFLDQKRETKMNFNIKMTLSSNLISIIDYN